MICFVLLLLFYILLKAQLLSIQRGEYWRAVSLEGWHPFHYSGFLNNDHTKLLNSIDKKGWLDVDEIRSNNEINNDLFNNYQKNGSDTRIPYYKLCTIQGNPTRELYKSSMWWNAENVRVYYFLKIIFYL